MGDSLQSILRQLRREFSQIWGERLRAVYLYGSQARGDARTNSDVDVLAVINGDFNYFDYLHNTDEIVSRLSLENDIVITLSLVSNEQFTHSQMPLFRNLARRDSGMTVTYWMEKSQENIEAAELLYEKEFYAIADARAYYAMFYAAQALLETIGLSFSKHAAVIAAFGKEFIKTGKLDATLHQYLISAQASRQTGDYGDGVYVTREEAERIILWAKAFYEAAKAYLNR